MNLDLLKKHRITVLLYLIGFIIIFDLSFYAAVPTMGFFVQAAVMIYISASVFIVLFRNSIRYYLLFPIPILGLWMISTQFLSSFSYPMLYPSLAISIFSIFFPAICHYFSRKRSMIGRIPISYISRSTIGLFSLVFFIFAINVLSNSPVQFDIFTKLMYFALLASFFVTSIMTYLNSSYRYLLLSKIVGSSKMDKEVSVVFEKIRANYPNNEQDCDLLQYFFKDALLSFEHGDYEKAFLSGYKVIREPTVVDPTTYVNDERKGIPSTFWEIRGTLMHSSSKHRRTDVEKIKKINPKLPKYSLEVIERAFEFLQELC